LDDETRKQLKADQKEALKDYNADFDIPEDAGQAQGGGGKKGGKPKKDKPKPKKDKKDKKGGKKGQPDALILDKGRWEVYP
jgi:hypothetical protein